MKNQCQILKRASDGIDLCIKLDMDPALQQVYDFAKSAHGEQRRKFADEPYIAHPWRVMQICNEYTRDKSILAAALLHDVLEDTPVTAVEILDKLRSTMPAETAELSAKYVQDLTDVYSKQNFPQWNRRKRKQKEADRLALASPEAQTIKYADIIDNSLDIVKVDTDFKKTYLLECRNLLNRMRKGIPELAKRARQTVDQCLASIRESSEEKSKSPPG